MTEHPHQDAGGAPTLLDGVVDVWSASLDPVSPTVSRLLSHLERDERARADRFVSARDRGRFVVGRAFLRMLLARHVGVPPGDLRFRYDTYGKPALTGADRGVRFNLAHSDALAVCAVGEGCGEIGVDIERVRPIADAGSVSRAFLSPGELGRLAALPEPARLRAFYEAWTRKEALLKALGCGLNRPLVDLEVSFGPGEPARLLRSLSDPGEVERFSLHAFEPESGYMGAVALAGRALQVRQRTWRWA
jgi:4'-phosphopantetheinyl transferase